MPINYGILQNIQPPQTIAQLPTVSSGDGNGDSIFSGLMGLIQGVAGIGSHSSQNPTQSYQNPQTYGTQIPSNTIGTPQFNQQPAPIGSITLGTWNNNQPGMSQQPLPSHLSNVVQQSSIWNNATKSLGLKEGDPTLTQYLMKANPNLDPTVTPWCAGYVNSVLNASGYKGTGSLAAKSFLNYGTPVNQPTQGDIVVFNDLTGRNDPNHGHVGFVQSIDYNKGLVTVLGGNQNNSVNMKTFPLSSVAGFRRPPSGQQVQQFAQQNNIQNPQQLPALSQQIATQQIQQTTNQYLKNPTQTQQLIANFEQFSPKSYWDVNANRIGYGTDTITRSDGSIIPVQKGMTISKEDAIRDLQRRSVEFAQTASKQVGADVWNNLPANIQAGLTSVAYNYGSLPKRIIPAILSGDPIQIANAVRGLQYDNKGINKRRRNDEANLILTGEYPSGNNYPGASGQQFNGYQ